MDIQAKIDRISSLIERIPETKEQRKDAALAAEFRAVSDDTSLPKVFREFCLNAARTASGDPQGPLDNSSKKSLREIFMKLKVN